MPPDEHPSDRKCKICGRDLPEPHWKYCDPPFLDRITWLAITCHDACLESYGRGGNTDGALAHWAANTPVEFRTDWNHTKGNERLLKRVLAYDHSKRKGMAIYGPSGTCKTRAVYQLMRRLSLDNISWLVLEGVDLLDGKIPSEAWDVDVLVIDDIGNEPMGKSADAIILKLLRRRCDWHKPVIITTNHTPDTFSSRFPGQPALAVIRRLGEFCEQINANG